MSTDLRFPAPKNPKDIAFYAILFPYQLKSVDSVAVLDNGVAAYSDVGRGAVFKAPGDLVSSPLVASELQQKGSNAVFLLKGGVPGREYVIEVGVTTSDGNVLFRSAALPVTGL